MKIVIDMQGWQTESGRRGIGRYTIEFVCSLLKFNRANANHEIFLLFNGAFEKSIVKARSILSDSIKDDHIVCWYPVTPLSFLSGDHVTNRALTEKIYNSVIAQINPDVIHLTSYFEGFVDDAYTSLNIEHPAIKSVLMFDLIPLVDAKNFISNNHSYAKFYATKVQTLNQADLLFCISNHTKTSCEELLQLQSTAVCFVGTAVDPDLWGHTSTQTSSSPNQQTMPYFFYCGGFDSRKNVKTLISAFADFLKTNSTDKYRLVLGGHLQPETQRELETFANKSNIPSELLHFTGHVTDSELAELYRSCILFIFPSLNEGFGLPVLEAMNAGAPVIVANASSLPEITNNPASVFNPLDVKELSGLLQKVTEDSSFVEDLKRNSSLQASRFTWESTIRHSFEFWRYELEKRPAQMNEAIPESKRASLAIVTPLPPQQSGVADFSSSILAELSRYYEITLVNDFHLDRFIAANTEFPVISPDDFQQAGDQFERILYHFGNSSFHNQMPELLEQHPGVIELHDFYLGGLHQSVTERLEFDSSTRWFVELLDSNGPISSLSMLKNKEHAKETHPSNFKIIQHARGVISHSYYSKKLFHDFYENSSLQPNWKVIPLPTREHTIYSKEEARNSLGLPVEAVILASFGSVYPTKYSLEILEAWISSKFSDASDNILIFVGENHGGEYGTKISNLIHDFKLESNVIVTGYIDSETYQRYLSAADAAIQLRGKTRGESSGALIDCFSAGLPTIINNTGSFSEIPDSVVYKIPEKFDSHELQNSLKEILNNLERREILKINAFEFSKNECNPQNIARETFKFIEETYKSSTKGVLALISEINSIDFSREDSEFVQEIARAIRLTLPESKPNIKLYIDISATVRQDHGSGIERVAKSLIWALDEETTSHVSVVPVYLCDECGPWHHHIALRFLAHEMGIPLDKISDSVVIPTSGDILLTADISGDIITKATEHGLYEFYKSIGVKTYSIVYDLLPIELPEVFPPGTSQSHDLWLRAISSQNGIFCISETVRDSYKNWQKSSTKKVNEEQPSFLVDVIPLGAEIQLTKNPEEFEDNISSFENFPTDQTLFLMVGTVEPRKGYLDAIDAFEKAISKGANACLVIVGKEGWISLPDSDRRDIPETIAKLNNHPLLNKRIFWYQRASDAELNQLYDVCHFLVANSFGEGFGLPLIEARAHGTRVVCRDLEVFREVADDSAIFFSNRDELSDLFLNLVQTDDNNTCPDSTSTPFRQSWSQAASAILNKLLTDNVSK